MPKMSSEEMEAYLNETHVADLATVNRDGSPHMIPIWYEYKDGTLYMISNKSGKKLHNIRRDSRVVVSVARSEQPYKYVIIEGTARVITEDIEEPTTSMCVRYMGQEKGSAFARRLLDGGNRVVIVMVPTKIMSLAFDWEY